MEHQRSLPWQLHITGETSCTGASTQAKRIATLVQSQRISGGPIFRAFAHHFHAYTNEVTHPHGSTQQQLKTFTNTYTHLLAHEGVYGVMKHVEPYMSLPENEPILTAFQTTLEQMDAKNPLWDRIVDEYQVMASRTVEGGYILESKLAILLPFIDQFRPYYQQHPIDSQLVLPVINMLLKVDPLVAQQRLITREGSATRFDHAQQRYTNDWLRYNQHYTINGTRVLPHQLKEVRGIALDTSTMSIDAVTTTLIAAMISQYNQEPDNLHQLTFRAIAQLQQSTS
jgi:cytidylate kinase